ncbi:TetR family transcriptional regulator [Rhizobiaceae bacterium]|nr:TetR family transcriptional regulator [Rhizobiaceae bacterium]
MAPQSITSSTKASAGPTTRERVLAAAEISFAECGYHAASMRQIATQAGVAQGLLHYHFDTKEQLYSQVVAWRAGVINASRLEMLSALGSDASLLDILTALYVPALGDDAGGAAFGNIMAAMLTGGELETRLVREHYDATAQVFIAAIEAATGLGHRDAAWGYSLAIHVLVAGMARNGRTERLADEREPADTQAFLDRLVQFAAGGIEGLKPPGERRVAND